MDAEYWDKQGDRSRRKAALPMGAAEGTILPGDEPGGYWFRGKEEWYWVSFQYRACSCPSYFYRGDPDRPCKHLTRLYLFLGKEPNGTHNHGA